MQQLALGWSLAAMTWNVHPVLGTSKCQKGAWFNPLCIVGWWLIFMARYCNMDYLFYQTLKGTLVLIFIISYDIACQWSINLYEQMFALDHEFFLFDNTCYIWFLVLKFHLPAHVEKFQMNFSFNYAKNVGCTDGESPECGWVKLNILAPSMREMGPGRRWDTINCNIGNENWKKFFGIGKRSIHTIVLCTTDNSAPQVKLCDRKLSQQLKTWQNKWSPIRNLNQLYPVPPLTNRQRILRSGKLIHQNQIPLRLLWLAQR